MSLSKNVPANAPAYVVCTVGIRTVVHVVLRGFTVWFGSGGGDDVCRCHYAKMYEVSFVERTQLAHRWRFAGARVGGADAARRDRDIKTSDQNRRECLPGSSVADCVNAPSTTTSSAGLRWRCFVFPKLVWVFRVCYSLCFARRRMLAGTAFCV